MSVLRWFRGQPRTLVPGTVLADLSGAITDRLITYDGRCLREAPAPLPEFGDYLGPTLAAARIDRERTAAEIAEAAFAQGGWALYGGCKLLEDLVDDDAGLSPTHLELMDASLEFLRDAGCSGLCLNGYERDRWVEVHGSMALFWDFEAVAVPPPGEEPPVADLSPGESRLVAVLEDRADSNRMLMQRTSDGHCIAVIDARWSNDDPRRSQSEWLRAEDPTALLRRVGESLNGLPFWASDELQPYIPYRRRQR